MLLSAAIPRTKTNTIHGARNARQRTQNLSAGVVCPAPGQFLRYGIPIAAGPWLLPPTTMRMASVRT